MRVFIIFLYRRTKLRGSSPGLTWENRISVPPPAILCREFASIESASRDIANFLDKSPAIRKREIEFQVRRGYDRTDEGDRPIVEKCTTAD